MERVMGIEPTLLAWEAKVLPLNYTRVRCRDAPRTIAYMVTNFAQARRQTMRITVNGEPKTLDTTMSVAGLLERMGMAGKRVAVEVNREIVPRSRHAGLELRDNDRVEIVVAIGGG